MNQSEIAIALSFASIGISLTTLGWSIYKEIFLRPRSLMRGGIYFIRQGDHVSEDYIDLQITNLGPGKITIINIAMLEGGLFKKLIRKQKKGVIIYDYTNELNPKLPMTIEQYNSASQYLILSKCNWINKSVTHLGFVDNLGRYHWVKRRHLAAIKRNFESINSSS